MSEISEKEVEAAMLALDKHRNNHALRDGDDFAPALRAALSAAALARAEANAGKPVAWLRIQGDNIGLCFPNDDGAFPVFRAAPQPSGPIIKALTAAKWLCDNINEFGQCNDAEGFDAAEAAIRNAITSELDTNIEWDGPLTDEEQAMVDAAWETHKAALPAAKVINDNQPGRTAIVEILREPPTLEVGTELYAAPVSAMRLQISDSAPQPSGPVTVKPLEWNEYEREGDVDEWDAFDGFSGYYNIVRGAFYFKLTLSDDKESPCKFQSPDEAKAAAQADYERRILSALTAGKPEQVPNSPVEALVDGLLDLRDKIVRGKRCVTDTGSAVKPVIETSAVHILDDAADALERLSALTAGKPEQAEAEAVNAVPKGMRPYRWHCKDFGDGWISFDSYVEASAYQKETGCIMRVVYVPAAPALKEER